LNLFCRMSGMSGMSGDSCPGAMSGRVRVARSERIVRGVSGPVRAPRPDNAVGCPGCPACPRAPPQYPGQNDPDTAGQKKCPGFPSPDMSGRNVRKTPDTVLSGPPSPPGDPEEPPAPAGNGRALGPALTGPPSDDWPVETHGSPPPPPRHPPGPSPALEDAPTGPGVVTLARSSPETPDARRRSPAPGAPPDEPQGSVVPARR